MSNSLQPHGLWHAGLPCPPLSPEVCSNLCPLSWWCYLTFLPLLPPLLLPSVFPRIRVISNELAFCIRWPSNGVSASASVLPMNIQGWFPLGWTCLISLLSKDSQESSPDPQFEDSTPGFGVQPSLWSNSHICIWLLESHGFDYEDLCLQCDVSTL